MAFSGNEFGGSKGALGLAFGNWSNTETGVIAAAVAKEGGFAVFGAEGEGDVVYATGGSGKYFRGVAARSTTADAFGAGDSVTIVKQGMVWVVAGGTVVDGQTAYVVAADGSFVATSNSGANAAVGTFKTSGSEDDLVILELK